MADIDDSAERSWKASEAIDEMRLPNKVLVINGWVTSKTLMKHVIIRYIT